MFHWLVSCLFIASYIATAPFTAHGQTESGGDFLAHVARNLGFNKKDREKVRAREIVSRAQEEAENELAAALAMVVNRPVAAIYRGIETNEVLRLGRTTSESHPIDPENPMAALSKLTLPADQIEDFRNASPGSNLNLSSEEIGQLRAAGSDALGVYRNILASRVSAYRQGGLAAVASYDRGGEKALPGGELAGAAERLSLLPKQAPGFWRAFIDFPVVASPGIEHQFWWLLLEVEGKPTPILAHRIFALYDDHAIVAERQFYVARSYNSLQIVVGIFALEAERSVLLYTNRTFTDQVTGFGSGARHRIGRTLLIDEVQTFFAAMRKELEKSPR